MKPSADIPHLQVVETAKLHPHELHDEQRAQPLVSALRRDRVLKNPPIVMPIEGRDDYVVLDGANRVTAFRLLECPHCLVQVAKPERESVEVKTWNHVLLGLSAEEAKDLFLTAGQEIKPASNNGGPKSAADLTSLEILFDDGAMLSLNHADDPLEQRIKNLNEIVDLYRNQVHFERTSEDKLAGMDQMYDSVAALVVFPEFEPAEVVKAVASEWHFPPGITRFIVSPRALRLNYPMAMLSGSESLSQKQEHLNLWIQSRVRNRRVRYYAESTFLFDE